MREVAPRWRRPSMLHSAPWACNVQMLRKFLNDESGATAIEYAVIAVGVSVVIVAAAQSIGTKVGSTFTSVQNSFN
jgi:pilus assembly protein Flp/PilA